MNESVDEALFEYSGRRAMQAEHEAQEATGDDTYEQPEPPAEFGPPPAESRPDEEGPPSAPEIGEQGPEGRAPDVEVTPPAPVEPPSTPLTRFDANDAYELASRGASWQAWQGAARRGPACQGEAIGAVLLGGPFSLGFTCRCTNHLVPCGIVSR